MSPLPPPSTPSTRSPRSTPSTPSTPSPSSTPSTPSPSSTPSTGETPRQRLVEAAIQEIERRGLAQLTVRAVAAAAGMNIAAVNYHFRSKQALVAAALESSIQHMVQDTDDYLARMPGDPPGVLAELLGYYLEGALRFPRLCKAHLHDAFVADDYSGPFRTLFAPAMHRLRQAVRAAVPGLDDGLAAQRVIATLSAVFFPAFFAGLYESFGTLDKPDERTRYVQEIARRTLSPIEPEEQGSGGRRRSRATSTPSPR